MLLTEDITASSLHLGKLGSGARLNVLDGAAAVALLLRCGNSRDGRGGDEGGDDAGELHVEGLGAS